MATALQEFKISNEIDRFIWLIKPEHFEQFDVIKSNILKTLQEE